MLRADISYYVNWSIYLRHLSNTKKYFIWRDGGYTEIFITPFVIPDETLERKVQSERSRKNEVD